MSFRNLTLVLGLLLAGCVEDAIIVESTNPIPAKKAYSNPADSYTDLFTQVQMGEVFADSKTFVDMPPKRPAAEIMSEYAQQKDTPGFDLKAFISANFEELPDLSNGFSSDQTLSLDEHIERLWPVLSRDEEAQNEKGSLIALPHDYIVPGGRFREIYYWDSYFTMLGLLVDDQPVYAKNMVDNFAFLINKIGFIPNGNRAYYLSRSQPPFFAPMVGLLVEEQGEELLLEYLPALEKEYSFWMRGSKNLNEQGDVALRTAKIKGDFIVNRYHDNNARPRPEGYREDSLLALNSNRDNKELYTNLRAACESGWDFSSRWLVDPNELGTIQTSNIAPVDLNSLLYYLEDMLAKAYALNDNVEQAQLFAKAAYERRRAVLTHFYDAELKWFVDYQIDRQSSNNNATLAGMYPLFFGLATEAQAKEVAERLELDFLKPGGLVTSLETTGQQWDAPNGWPPLQWVAIAGLRKYGHKKLAKEIASRWLTSGRKVYAKTGKVVEKYNVVDTTLLAGGGEYPNQDGFGWSNGVFARIMHDYPKL
ncbi:MAG: alpha,alpha-trehalase TreF [Saprospiraceae bacterium]